MAAVCPKDPLFCLEFVEIASLEEYEPGAWDMNEPKRKGEGLGKLSMGKDSKPASPLSRVARALEEKEFVAKNKRL